MHKNIFLDSVRQFSVGEEVWGQNFSVGYKWMLSIVMCNTGFISYKDMTTNEVLKLHLDHSRKKETATNEIIYLKISEPVKGPAAS